MKRIAFVLLGWTTASLYGQGAGSVPPAQAACGAGKPKYTVATTPLKATDGDGEGKSRLYLLEVQDRVGFCPFGCGELVKLGLDGNWVGATKGSSYLVLPISGGAHHVCAEWDTFGWRQHKHLELAPVFVEPGKSYYFRVHITQGTPDSIESYRFEPVNEDEGKLLVASLPRTVSTKR